MQVQRETGERGWVPKSALPQYRDWQQFRQKAGRKHMLRRILWHAQGGKCAWCGRDIGTGVGNEPLYCRVGDTTFDHVVPLSRGGGTNPDNLVLACRKCNLARANKGTAQEVKA